MYLSAEWTMKKIGRVAIIFAGKTALVTYFISSMERKNQYGDIMMPNSRTNANAYNNHNCLKPGKIHTINT